MNRSQTKNSRIGANKIKKILSCFDDKIHIQNLGVTYENRFFDKLKVLF